MRERLIGAIVLIVIAAIMVPLLMTHAHNPNRHLRDEHLRDVALAAAPPASVPAALALASATANASVKAGQLPLFAGASQSAPASATLVRAPAQTVVRTAPSKQTVAVRVAKAPISKPTPGQQRVSQTTMPQTSAHEIAEATVPPTKTPASHRTQQAASPPASAPAAAPSGPPLGQGILHEGDWYVQVASFASHANAAQMAILLTRAGYHAFLSSNEVRGTLYYRVRVGPYPSEDRAQAVAPGLAAVSGSKVLVRQASGSDG